MVAEHWLWRHHGRWRTRVVKYIEKPKIFRGTLAEWHEWKFKMRSWISTWDPDMPALMDLVEARDTPAILTNGDVAHQANMLYVISASFLADTPLRQIEAQDDRNGFECWRLHVQYYEPRTANRKASMLGRLLDPDLEGGRGEMALLRALTYWEVAVLEHEGVSGRAFDKHMMRAIVATRSPPAM